LPQTLEDGEAFGEDWRMRDILKCCPATSPWVTFFHSLTQTVQLGCTTVSFGLNIVHHGMCLLADYTLSIDYWSTYLLRVVCWCRPNWCKNFFPFQQHKLNFLLYVDSFWVQCNGLIYVKECCLNYLWRIHESRSFY
jgi:hypothetical protein